jgi:hypothetical protein
MLHDDQAKVPTMTEEETNHLTFTYCTQLYPKLKQLPYFDLHTIYIYNRSFNPMAIEKP